MALMAPASSDKAQAQWTERPRTQKPARAATQIRLPQPAPDSPLLALISIGSQRLDIYDRHGLVGSSPISSGRRGHESPQGIFSIIEKKEEHFSNLYDDAAMPFMQRITWSGVAMHAGALPGYPASHGCIRLPHGFARAWFDVTKLNTRVVITRDETMPLSISHRTLLQPRLASVAAAQPEREAAPSGKGIEAPVRALETPPKFSTEDGGVEAPMMLGARLPRPAAAGASAEPKPATVADGPFVSPKDAARRIKAAADKRLAETTKAADAARLAAKQKTAEANHAERDAKAEEAAYKRTVPRLAGANRTAAAAQTDALRDKADLARARLVTELATMAAEARESRAEADKLAAELKSVQATLAAADKERASAQAAARDAARLGEPVSVFVSLATQRVYVRQNREPVLDMALKIAEPSRPIGTHVFTAMSSADGGRSVAWKVVTVESGEDRDASLPRESGARGGRPVVLASARDGDPQQRATAALDRIQLPPEVLDRVTPWLTVGSSLIVSDLGPSFETGNGTDFVVQTKGEEEARESVRRIVAQKRLERTRRANWDDDDESDRRRYASRRNRSSW
jgi:L,D-transpeptidase catalytic domain